MKQLKFGIVFLLCLCVFLSSAAFAAGETAQDAGRITVVNTPDGVAAPGVEFRLYRVADVVKGKLQWTAPYDAWSLNLEPTDPDSFTMLPEVLRQYIARDNIAPDRTGTTDDSGYVSFAECGQGMYLITGADYTRSSTRYRVSPCMVILPYILDGDGTPQWTAKVEVKHTASTISPDGGSDSGSTISRRVMKIWNDAGFEDHRPDSITVQLLRDGKVYRTVQLNESNGWKHTWTGLPKNHVYCVAENDVPDGYCAEVDQHGTTFSITNSPTQPQESESPNPSPSPDDSVPPTDSTPPTTTPSPSESVPSTVPPTDTTDKPDNTTPIITEPPATSTPTPSNNHELPQTGQLWMPVFVLSVAGLFLILIGVAMRGQAKLREEIDEKVWREEKGQ